MLVSFNSIFVALVLFLPSAPEARHAREQLSQSKMGCVEGSHKLERLGLAEKFCYFIFRQPRAMQQTLLRTIGSAARLRANIKFEIL
jgi:hypothetical protein